MIRRASSFKNEFIIDSSQYFNNKIKELKKTNSHQNLLLSSSDVSENLQSIMKSAEPSKKEKTVTWKDADNYFKQDIKMLTPVPTTGRASVAKLRTQNAGMVLAKAKLFDEPSKEKIVDLNRRQSMKLQTLLIGEQQTTPCGKK